MSQSRTTSCLASLLGRIKMFGLSQPRLMRWDSSCRVMTISLLHPFKPAWKVHFRLRQDRLSKQLPNSPISPRFLSLWIGQKSVTKSFTCWMISFLTWAKSASNSWSSTSNSCLKPWPRKPSRLMSHGKVCYMATFSMPRLSASLPIWTSMVTWAPRSAERFVLLSRWTNVNLTATLWAPTCSKRIAKWTIWCLTRTKAPTSRATFAWRAGSVLNASMKSNSSQLLTRRRS